MPIGLFAVTSAGTANGEPGLILDFPFSGLPNTPSVVTLRLGAEGHCSRISANCDVIVASPGRHVVTGQVSSTPPFLTSSWFYWYVL